MCDCGGSPPVDLVILGTNWWQMLTDKELDPSSTDGVNTWHACTY